MGADITAAVGRAHAAGCLKSATVGAVAGHVAGHYAVIGAVGGCIVGHHYAKEKEKNGWQPRANALR
ncbi:hypothetical protein [Caballeronia mineralivorans]|uniref:hypothetical protein n=1 Tax=Caballeronia mineralivorans TaxID=2010198 RepID=UPI0023F28A7F|nr:hypothetical protein [Caballeronia mineralivorans]